MRTALIDRRDFLRAAGAGFAAAMAPQPGPIR
ncbi:twin-arginine translocation signal domain-containing protein [Mesorhizobium atlanticum]